jgi:hypothetical protein
MELTLVQRYRIEYPEAARAIRQCREGGNPDVVLEPLDLRLGEGDGRGIRCTHFCGTDLSGQRVLL